MTTIAYSTWREKGSGATCFDLFAQRVRELCEDGSRVVTEVGGGARPLLSPDFVAARGVDYTVVDLSPAELAKAPPGYKTVAADICAVHPPPSAPADLVFSRTLAEHVHNPARFHRNVYLMLKPGGKALHFFPTLYALPFVVNKVAPERLSNWILLRLQEGRGASGTHGKFQAHYRWCRGPTRRQLRRLREIGFRIVRYEAFFGHGYFDRAPSLSAISQRIGETLASHPVPLLTSYAIVELERPGAAR
jgi:SAM-dependent methyltransferase